MLVLAEVKGQNSCGVSQESPRDTRMQLTGNSHVRTPSGTSYQVITQSLPPPVSNTSVDLFARILTQIDKLSF